MMQYTIISGTLNISTGILTTINDIWFDKCAKSPSKGRRWIGSISNYNQETNCFRLRTSSTREKI